MLPETRLTSTKAIIRFPLAENRRRGRARDRPAPGEGRLAGKSRRWRMCRGAYGVVPTWSSESIILRSSTLVIPMDVERSAATLRPGHRIHETTGLFHKPEKPFFQVEVWS